MSYEITDFTREVLERSKTIPVLVDFWAEWCGPCRILGPVLERIAGQNRERFVLAKVDTDKHQQVAAQYGVRGIPNVKLFVNGKVVDEFTGALPEHAVVQWLERVLPGKYDNDLGQAEVLIASGGREGARKVLESVLERDMRNEHARVLLGKILLEDDPMRVLELVSTIEEHSKHFPLADALKTIATLVTSQGHAALPEDEAREEYSAGIDQLMRHKYDDAIGHFIEVIRRNRQYDNDGARKACVAIFRYLGDDHEITLRRRREFSSALNR